MGSAVSERVERVERMEPSDRRQRREPAEPAQRFERSEPDFYQTTSPFHEREHALRQEREAVSTEMDDWKSPYSAHSRFPNPELPEKPSVSPREAPSANQRHASPSPPRRAPSPRKLSVDLEISTEGRDSLPKDATPEQIARWLGTELPDIHVNEKPALQRTIGPKSPLADAVIAKTPMPSDEWKSPLGVSKPSARLNSPDYKPPKAPVTISLTSPVITLPSTSYASIDRAGSPAPLSLVSLRLPWTSPGVTSRLRCTIKNPGTTNAPWMLSKVGHAKAQPPDSERPLLLEEDVFRWSDEKGVVAAEGETVLRLSFLPTFTGRFTQSFHMRCRGRVIVVEVVGIVGNRGAGTKEREALPSTPSYKTEAVQVQPPQTPFIRHPRLANLASTSTSDIPKSPTTPGFYTAEAESILEANSGGATPLFTLELLRRPPDSAPPTFREIGGERVQYFDFGRILSGDRAKITMRAVNPNRTSVLVRTALKGRDTRSFILPFRTLLVPRESFVPFPLVFEGKKSGMWEQEVELAASGGGGAFTRIRVVLVGEVV